MKLSIRTTPYFQWLVESRTGRKRKVLGRFGDERNAKQFLAGLTKGSVDLDNGKKPNGHRARAGATPAASSYLTAVSLLLTAIACCAVSVCAADGGQSNVHPSSGFTAPASGPTRDDGVVNGNAWVNDTALPQPIAGGGFNFRGLFALGIVTASACAGLLTIASSALSGRLDDPR